MDSKREAHFIMFPPQEQRKESTVSIAHSALQRLNITTIYQTIGGCLLG